jgi:VanZ family protein
MTRGRLALAAVAFGVLVVYASLVPFDQHPVSASRAWALLRASWPPAITSKTDFIANVILQFPLGFLLSGALTRDRRGRPLAPAVTATVIVAMLAFAIEFAQGMFAARTPSVTDVLAETIGGLGGAIAWRRSGAWLTAGADHGWDRVGSPALACLGIYIGAWVLWRWMPFDFTLRVPELLHKYREGSMVLWSDPPGAAGIAELVGGTARQWLLALPVGAAACLATRGTRLRRDDAAVLVACGVTVAVHLADFATLTRPVDLGDVAAAGLGGATGVWWAERPVGVRGAVVALAAMLALLIDQWAPFRFSAAPQPFGLRPFQAYLLTTPSQAVNEGLLKLLLGFAVAFVGWLGGRRAPLPLLLQWIAFALVVEAGQMFVAGRYADISDVLIVSAGALAGVTGRLLFEPEREAGGPVRTVHRTRRSRGERV